MLSIKTRSNKRRMEEIRKSRNSRFAGGQIAESFDIWVGVMLPFSDLALLNETWNTEVQGNNRLRCEYLAECEDRLVVQTVPTDYDASLSTIFHITGNMD
ncbi:hypothetical protein TNCV_963331 [Trichonephila clavipes]|nr:hypothetical protein TNCV_963331 [Trichonephila clavipes]